MQIIETERLTIEQLETPDATFIITLVNSPGWLEFIGDRGIKNIADAENYLVNGPIASYQANGFGLYRVSIKETGTAIGICGIIKRDTLEQPDIGFALLPEYTGKGYALEAAAAVLDHARRQLGLQTVLAITLERNIRSVGLLKKLGLVFDKNISLANGKEPLMLFTTTWVNDPLCGPL